LVAPRAKKKRTGPFAALSAARRARPCNHFPPAKPRFHLTATDAVKPPSTARTAAEMSGIVTLGHS